MDVLRHGKEHSFQNQFCFYAAMSFIKMGMIDSARSVMSIMPPPEDEMDSMAYYDLSAELSKAKGQMEQYGKNTYHSYKVEREILLSSRKSELMVIDSVFNLQQSESRNTAVIKRDKYFISTAIVLIILLSLFIRWLRRRQKAIQQEKEQITMELEQAMAKFKEQKLEANDTNVSRIVGLRLQAIQELYQGIRIKDDNSSRVKKIVPLTSFLKSLHEHNSLMVLEMKDTFWEKMRESVDGEMNDIVTFVEQHYPALTTRDLQFFTLICARISPQLIRLCMDIINAKSVTNIRRKLMNKMGLDMSFDEFVTKYMNGEMESR